MINGLAKAKERKYLRLSNRTYKTLTKEEKQVAKDKNNKMYNIFLHIYQIGMIILFPIIYGISIYPMMKEKN